MASHANSRIRGHAFTRTHQQASKHSRHIEACNDSLSWRQASCFLLRHAFAGRQGRSAASLARWQCQAIAMAVLAVTTMTERNR